MLRASAYEHARPISLGVKVNSHVLEVKSDVQQFYLSILCVIVSRCQIIIMFLARVEINVMIMHLPFPTFSYCVPVYCVVLRPIDFYFILCLVPCESSGSAPVHRCEYSLATRSP